MNCQLLLTYESMVDVFKIPATQIWDDILCRNKCFLEKYKKYFYSKNLVVLGQEEEMLSFEEINSF